MEVHSQLVVLQLPLLQTLVTGDVIDFIQILGNVLDLGVPSDSTVSLAKLTATGTKDATTFLRGDNTFDTPPLGGITMVDRWRLITNFTNSAQPIASNLERADETDAGFIGTGMTESSGIFTFPSTGIYLLQAQFSFQLNGDARDIACYISRTIDNSSYSVVSGSDIFIQQTSGATAWNANFISYTFDVTNTSTHKVRFEVECSSNTSTTTRGDTNSDITAFTFIRLGDT